MLIAVPSITFLLFALLPADPVRTMLGVNASEQAVQDLRRELGYDQPLVARLGNYLARAAQLDFGSSLVTRRPVLKEVVAAYGVTVSYVAIALCIAAISSLLLLVVAHFSSSALRKVFLAAARAVAALPSIVVAIAAGLITIAVAGPAGLPSGTLRTLVVAPLALAVYPTLSLAEILLSERQAAMRSAAVRAADSFGFSRCDVLRSCVLRLILLPWLAQLSNLAAALVSGSIVIELIFSMPGLGRLVVQSVLRNDAPMMQAVVIMGVLTFLSLNALSSWVIRTVYASTPAC